MFFCFLFWLKSSISITESLTSMKICNYTSFFLVCALSGYICITSSITDRYQHKKCIIMEAKTETNMKICMYKDSIGCEHMQHVVIFFYKLFTSCVTDRL